jgi:NACHT domain
MDVRSPRRMFAPVALLILALGGPAVVLASLRRVAVAHPVEALAGIVLYEAILIVVAFVTEVGRGLRTRWVDRLVDRIDIGLQYRFSRYQRAYLNKVTTALGSASAAGQASLPFDVVYTEVHLREFPPGRRVMSSAAWPPRPGPADAGAADEGSQTIWDLLGQDGAQARLLVFGGVGMGKTTLARHVALTLARYPPENRRIPLLIQLEPEAEVGAAISTDLPLATLARSMTPESTVREPPEWFEDQLRRGQCVVVLDGLADAGQGDDSAVRRWLHRQFSLYPDASFLVTCGPLGSDAWLQNFTSYAEIRPLTAGQVEELSGIWRGTTPAPPDALTAGGNSNFLSDLRTAPGAWAFAGNPLLLEASFKSFDDGQGQQPRHRELLAAICAELLGHARYAAPDLTAGNCQEALEYMAYHATLRHSLCITAPDADRDASEAMARAGCASKATDLLRVMSAVGIFQRSHAGGEAPPYAFAHPALQDFFAAGYLARHRPSDPDLDELVQDAWWWQALRLIAEPDDRARIVAACIRPDHPSGTCLALARDCLDGLRDELETSDRSRADAIFSGQEGGHKSSLREAGLIARLNRTAALDGYSQILLAPLTNEDYQLFADDAEQDGDHYFLDHWNADHFPPGKQAEAAAGIRSSDLQPLCDWLTGNHGGYWRYRIPEESELAAARFDSAGIKLPEDPFWIRAADGPTCRSIPSERIAESLRTQMQMDIIRDLSFPMRQCIPSAPWQRLRRPVRPAAGVPPPWGLDPKVETELGLDVPWEPFAALGVVLAEPQDPEAASEVASQLGLDEHDLSATRLIVQRVLNTPADDYNMDADAGLSGAYWLQQAAIELYQAGEGSYWRRMPEELDFRVTRLRWLAAATWSAAEAALYRQRHRNPSWPAVKAFRWCARVTSLTLAVEVQRLFAGPDTLSVTERLITGTGNANPSDLTAMDGFFEELIAAAVSIYVCLALVDIRSYSDSSSLGVSAVLAREPAYPPAFARKGNP